MKRIIILALFFSFVSYFSMSSTAIAGSSGLFMQGSETICDSVSIFGEIKDKIIVRDFCTYDDADIKGNTQICNYDTLNIYYDSILFGNIECCKNTGGTVYIDDGVVCKGNIGRKCTITGPGAGSNGCPPAS